MFPWHYCFCLFVLRNNFIQAPIFSPEMTYFIMSFSWVRKYLEHSLIKWEGIQTFSDFWLLKRYLRLIENTLVMDLFVFNFHKRHKIISSHRGIHNMLLENPRGLAFWKAGREISDSWHVKSSQGCEVYGEQEGWDNAIRRLRRRFTPCGCIEVKEV